ncbi:MAG: alpha/beta hydrolase [Actinomycetota bacterium]|nr:alpha/beta hydrolase [Actinomycetota bacterium]
MVPTGVGLKCQRCTGSGGRGGHVLGTRRRVVQAIAGVAVVAAAVAAVVFAVDRPSSTTDRQAQAAGVRVDHIPVTFEGAGGFTLHGAMDLPEGFDGPLPGVVIVPGYGDTTRDGVVGDDGPGDLLYLDLGVALAQEGFAVLRFDKRGSGESTPLTDELRFDQRVEDAVRAVAFLRDQPDVADDAISVVGHDGGGVIGLHIADGALDLDGLVLVNVPGRPLSEVLIAEFRRAGDEMHDDAAEELQRAFQTLRETGEVPQVSDMLRPVFSWTQPGYLREIIDIDPAQAATRVVSPVLIVHGQRDASITDEDVQALRAGLTAAPEVDVVHRPDADHTLRLAGGGRHDGAHGDSGAPAERSAPGARDRAALDEIVRWLVDVAGREAQAQDRSDRVDTAA